MKKSLERIEWRFQKSLEENKGFIPNRKDIDAYNDLEKQYKERRGRELNANEYLVKLYIVCLGNLLKISETTVFDSYSRRVLLDILKKPLSNIVADFARQLNDSEMYTMLENAGRDFGDYPALRPLNAEETRVLESEKFKKASCGEIWTEDVVWKNLKQEIFGLFDELEKLENEKK